MRPTIRERRMERHMTQKELADMLGMNQSQLSRYENGVTAPSLEVLYRIEEILDCRLKDLYEKID